MALIEGLFAVMVCIVCWGSYLIPVRRHNELSPFSLQLMMGMGIFLSSLVFALLTHTIHFSLLAIISGALWAIGNIISVFAIRRAGIARAYPLWGATSIPAAFIGGLLFGETLHLFWLAIVGIIIQFIGVRFITKTMPTSKEKSWKGIALSLLAGLFFGVYLYPFKMTSLSPIEFLFPMSIGVGVTTLLIYLLQRDSLTYSTIIPGIGAGVLWNIANFASFFAVQQIGLALTTPLTALSLLVTVSWGLFYFKEITKSTMIKLLITGSLLLLIGGTMIVSSL